MKHGDPTATTANPSLQPGDLVRLPARPDWGVGQIQSIIGERITVNFEDGGKVVLNAAVAILEPAGTDDQN